jgi:DNA repair protein RadC
MTAATVARDSAANYQPLIRDLPPDERPRERLANHGVGALSTAELLAITFRVGRPGESALAMATRLLASFEGLEGLAQTSFGELASQPSVGGAKSAQIKAGLELGKRLLTTAPAERPVITDPRDVNNLFAGDMGFLEQEHLRVLLLTTKNQVVDIVDISRGTVNTTQVRPAEVFREAVRRTSPAIIVDHVIICQGRFISLNARGLGF